MKPKSVSSPRKPKSCLRGVGKAKSNKYVHWPIVYSKAVQEKLLEVVEGERVEFIKLSGDAQVMAWREVNKYKREEMLVHPASKMNNLIHFRGGEWRMELERKEKVKEANRELGQYDWHAVMDARELEEEAAAQAEREKEAKEKEEEKESQKKEEQKEEDIEENEDNEEFTSQALGSQAPDCSELDTAFFDDAQEEDSSDEEEFPCSQAPGASELDTAFVEE
jgi:hypothetical protein